MKNRSHLSMHRMARRGITVFCLIPNLVFFLAFCGLGLADLGKSSDEEVKVAMARSEERNRKRGPEVPADLDSFPLYFMAVASVSFSSAAGASTNTSPTSLMSLSLLMSSYVSGMAGHA